MKKSYFISSILIFAICIGFLSCDDCEIVSCENEWEIFDASSCSCIADLELRCQNGIKDGDELFIDCGGSCASCECEYESCDDLTRSTQKTWVHLAVIEIGDTIPVNDHPNGNYKDIKMFFRVDHTMTLDLNGARSDYVWEFDNDENPEQLNLEHIAGEDNMVSSLQILRFNSDTLHMAASWYNVISISL